MSGGGVHISADPDDDGAYRGVFIEGRREIEFKLVPDGDRWRICDATGATLFTATQKRAWDTANIVKVLRRRQRRNGR